MKKRLAIIALTISMCLPGFCFAYGGGGGGDGGGADRIGGTLAARPSLEGSILFGAGIDPQSWVLGFGSGMGLSTSEQEKKDSDHETKDEKTTAAAEFIGQLIIGEATGVYASWQVDMAFDLILDQYDELPPTKSPQLFGKDQLGNKTISTTYVLPNNTQKTITEHFKPAEPDNPDSSYCFQKETKLMDTKGNTVNRVEDKASDGRIKEIEIRVKPHGMVFSPTQITTIKFDDARGKYTDTILNPNPNPLKGPVERELILTRPDGRKQIEIISYNSMKDLFDNRWKKRVQIGYWPTNISNHEAQNRVEQMSILKPDKKTAVRFTTLRDGSIKIETVEKKK